MGKNRIQYKDKPVILGGRAIDPYTFFINEQDTMTAFARSVEVRYDKLGRDYIPIEILLSRDGAGYWYKGLLFANGRVAYIDGKDFKKLRGLYPKVYDAFLHKFATTEIKHAVKRRDIDDDSRIFGDLPIMRQPQRDRDFTHYRDTYYQIYKISNGSESSNDFNENRSTNSCLWWYGVNWEGRGRVSASSAKTKQVDYTKRKNYVPKADKIEIKKRGAYFDQFNDDEIAWVCFRDSMMALRDEMAR